MNVTYRCLKCDQTVYVPFNEEQREISCPACNDTIQHAADAVAATNTVNRCIICNSDELFVRKDFSQTLGVAIITVGFILASIAWFYYLKYWTFGILFATAAIDFVLYLYVGNLLECYRCHSQYRQVTGLEQHGAFDLEVHERHRQQAARMKDAEAQQVSSES